MDDFNKYFPRLRFLILVDNIQFLAEKIMVSIGLIVATLVLAVSRVYAIFTGTPILWASELSQYVMIWTVFIGASLLIRSLDHVKLDIILKFISKKAELFLEILIYFFAGLFLLFFMYVGWGMAMDVYTSGQTMTNIHLSMGWAYLSFPLGSLLMAMNAFKIVLLKIGETKHYVRGDKH